MLAVNDWFDIAMLYVNLLHIVYDWFDAVLHVKGMLHTSLNDWFDFAVLHMPVFIIYVVSMLLLSSGDVEVNPGPFYTVCPNCNIQVHVRKKLVNVVISFLENMESWQLDVQLVQLKMQGLLHQLDPPHLMFTLK